MAEVILQDELALAISDNSFIKNGITSCCEGMKYDFRLSSRILKADFKQPVDVGTIIAEDQKNLVIKPGEVVFVMTQESIELPNNIFCQLSAKRKLSHDGIIILGGFTIDPNYSGKLIFGLYNISSKEYPIRPGKKLVAGVFYKLNEEDTKNFTTKPESLYDFPDELVRMISEYKSVAMESLSEDLNTLKADLKFLKDQMDSDKSWKDEFQQGLAKHNEQLTKLGEALQDITKKLGAEIDERKDGLSRLEANFSVVRGIGLVLGSLVGGGLVMLLIAWMTGILNLG